jgi:glycosyltransferase involved in cell wall biosynthesis
MPDVQFHLYGDLKTLGSRVNRFFYPNVKFFEYVTYNNIPKILNNYNIALMPLQNKILARSHNLEISRYISPLKMFDYLSSGKILIASNLKAYDHILKNNENSFLLSNKNISTWKNLIQKIINNPNNFIKIKVNAISTAKKYSWENRAKSFYRFIEN